MKIAILGSAPSSVNLAPFGDPGFKIWACSPGTYSLLPRCDAFFELHRWEPGVIGKPHTQKQWFSPEYVAWMGMQSRVWMQDVVPEIPNSARLPVEDLEAKYGTYFFTSSIAWMMACAIEDVLEEREQRKRDGMGQAQDVIALFGVDMSATEEYGNQRLGCQHFALLAADLGIQVYVPPESDLLRPLPRYGIDESSHWMIKVTARKAELQNRLALSQQREAAAVRETCFLQGALDDLDYMAQTWCSDREGKGTSYEIMAQSPLLREAVLQSVPPLVAVDAGLRDQGQEDRPRAKTNPVRLMG